MEEHRASAVSHTLNPYPTSYTVFTNKPLLYHLHYCSFMQFYRNPLKGTYYATNLLCLEIEIEHKQPKNGRWGGNIPFSLFCYLYKLLLKQAN